MPPSPQLLGIYAATLVCHGLLNTFANSILGFLNGESQLQSIDSLKEIRSAAVR